jgi:hypothetical protein
MHILWNHQLQHPIHSVRRTTPKHALPYRRTPALPTYSQIDRTVMDTDWEAIYRSWKDGFGWRNRVKMFKRCERWLQDMQEDIWGGRPWAQMVNYRILERQENEEVSALVPPANADADAHVLGLAPNVGPAVNNEDEEMQEAGNENDPAGLNGYEQFQWP